MDLVGSLHHFINFITKTVLKLPYFCGFGCCPILHEAIALSQSELYIHPTVSAEAVDVIHYNTVNTTYGYINNHSFFSGTRWFRRQKLKARIHYSLCGWLTLDFLFLRDGSQWSLRFRELLQTRCFNILRQRSSRGFRNFWLEAKGSWGHRALNLCSKFLVLLIQYLVSFTEGLKLLVQLRNGFSYLLLDQTFDADIQLELLP